MQCGEANVEVGSMERIDFKRRSRYFEQGSNFGKTHACKVQLQFMAESCVHVRNL